MPTKPPALIKKATCEPGDIWYHPLGGGRPFVVRIIDAEGVHSENLDDGGHVVFPMEAMANFDFLP